MNADRQHRQLRLISRVHACARVAAGAILLGALVVQVLIPILTLQWLRRPFTGAFFTHNLVIMAVETTGGETGEQLEPAQRLIAVNGVRVENSADLDTLLDTLSLGQTVTLTVQLPGARTRDLQTPGSAPESSSSPIVRQVPITLSAFPTAELLRGWLIPYLTGLGFLAIGIIAAVRSAWPGLPLSGQQGQITVADKRLPWVAFYAMASIALSAVFEVRTTHQLDSLWLLALPLASVFLIDVGTTFLPNDGAPLARRLALLALVAALPFMIWSQAALYFPAPQSNGPAMATTLRPWLPGAAFAAAGVVVFVGLLAHSAAQNPSRHVQVQAQTMLIGTAAAVAPTILWAASLVLAQVLPGLIQPYRFEPLINVPTLLLLPLSAISTIWPRVLWQSRLWLATARSSPIDQAANAGRRLAVGNEPDHRRTVEPLRSQDQDLVSKGVPFPGTSGLLHSVGYPTASPAAGGDVHLRPTMDTALIIDQLLASIDQVLQPTHALAFIISADDTYQLQRAYRHGSGSYGEDNGSWGDGDIPQNIRFTHDDRLIVRLQHDGQSIHLSPRLLDELRLDDIERLRLEQLGACGHNRSPLASESLSSVAVPLCSQEHLIGMLIIGPQSSGEGYTADDLGLLDTMADQATVATQNALLYAQQLEQEQRLLRQTRRLTDILALGNQLKSLDREMVVKSTVNAVHDRLGFGLVTLSLVQEDNPTRVRVVAWDGIESAAWERLTHTSFPLIDLDSMPGTHQIENCYLVCAPGTTLALSTSQHAEPWHEGDQLFVPLTVGDSTSGGELLGYLTVDQPEDQLRPTEDTLEVLEIFANQAAIAIQNANLYASIDRALDDRVAELATLHEIDTALNVKLDFDYVMNITLEWAMRITHAIAGTLALTSLDSKSLHIVAHQGYPAEFDRYWSTPWPVDEGIMGRVIRSGEPEMIDDVARNLDYPGVDKDTYLWPGVPRCHLAAPIKREDRISGVISLESDQANGFTVDDLAFLLRFADHAAVVVENVRMYQETNRRVAELSALQQISLDLTSSLNLSAVLDSVAQNTMALTQADGTTIYLYDEHEEALFFGTGLSREGQQERPHIPIPEDNLTMAVARRGIPTVIHDTKDDRSRDNRSRNTSLEQDGSEEAYASLESSIPALLSEWDIGAIASIPLQKAGHVLGVFDVVFRQPHFFSPDELRALNLLADQAAIAVQNAQLFLEVQRANEAKSEFVSIVSHELKIPMTSIQGYARLITLGAAGPVTAQQMEFANVILKNVDRMAGLVSDLLDLSRIESGRIQITPRPVDLSKLAQDAARSLQDQLEKYGHTLEIAIPADVANVEADPARIMQVWVNLLSNAFKYTPRGGRVKVWARQHGSNEDRDNGERWVLCAVEDNGIGIDAQDQERVFEQFYRVNHPNTKSEQGTGLGLSITRSIIELHGGHIWVESVPGKGSTFYFTLPAV